MFEPVQLDLFDPPPAPVVRERAVTGADRHRAEALTCLRDAVPEALELVVRLRSPSRVDSRAPCANPDWAYCTGRRGLRYERHHDWSTGARERGESYAWNRTPANLLPWNELAVLVRDDPRHRELVAWVDSLPFPRWQLTHRPHELWDRPQMWHPSYIETDHAHPLWPERLRAWQVLIALLTDTITSLTTPDPTNREDRS